MNCKRILPGFIVCIIACFSAITVTCQKGTTGINPNLTDVVTITDINKYINDSDIAAGNQKTSNYVTPVKMSHTEHEKAGLKCITCHHKHNNDDRIKQCAYCHKGTRGDEIMHNFCITCHVEKKKGPALCQDCHKTGSGL